MIEQREEQPSPTCRGHVGRDAGQWPADHRPKGEWIDVTNLFRDGVGGADSRARVEGTTLTTSADENR